MVVLVAIYFCYTQLTGSTVLEEYPKLTTMAYGGQFLQGALRVMVSSVTHGNFMPYRRTTIFSWSLLAFNAFSLIYVRELMFNEYWMMCTICVIVWGALAHFVYYVLQDLKRILGINIFIIKPMHTKD